MATVYKATQLGLEREVAVKVLHVRGDASKQLEEFFREARTLAKLEHPNIVTIYAVGQEQEQRFLVMQLITGGTLMGLLKERGRLPAGEAVTMIKQVAQGLAEAHRKGVIHRDVKPHNVLVAPGPRLMLTDFGLALMSDETNAAFAQGRVVGTPHYMSPEQIDARPVDARTDIYALGATLYHLLTGTPPFQAESVMELLVKQVQEAPQPPHERCPAANIPPALSRVVLRTLAKAPEARPATVEAFLAELEAWEKRPTAADTGAKAPEAEQRPVLLLSQEELVPLERLYVPVRARRSPALAGAALGLAALTGLLVTAGLGPLQVVFGKGEAADEQAGAEVEDLPRSILAGLTQELSALNMEEEGARDRARERLLAFAQRFPGAPEAAEAQAQAAKLAEQIEQALRARIGAGLQRAKELGDKGELGPALDALAPVRRELGASAQAKPVAELEGELRAELARIGMAWVPAGDALLGDERGRRFVPAFYIQVREVSGEEYAAFLAAHPALPEPAGWRDRRPPDGAERLPATGVTGELALRYAAWRGLRLPKEQEWEKAARGDAGGRWPWGDERHDGHCGWGPTARLEPVDSPRFPKDTSPYGCRFMAGNAAELTLAQRSLPGKPRFSARAGGAGWTQVLDNTRPAFHIDRIAPGEAHPAVGFRCAADELPPALRRRP